MRAHATLRLLAALQAFLLIASLMVPGLAAGAVSTDQADYSPGSVVTISGDNSDGAGYLPGETIDVVVVGPNGYAASCSAVADDAGAWWCQVTLWDTELAVGAYSYTATGASSGVTQSGTFTDAVNYKIDSASLTIHSSDCSTGSSPFASGATVCTTATVAVSHTGSGSDVNPVTLFLNWYDPSAAIAFADTSAYSADGTTSTNFSHAVSALGIWTVNACRNVTCTGGGNVLATAEFTVTAAATTTTVGSITATASTFGGTTNLSATVSPSNAPGSVAFFVNGSLSPIASTYVQATGVATVTGYTHGLGAGTYSVKAAFTATNPANYTNSNATNATALVVGQASSTVTIDCTAGAPYTYTGSAQTPCTAQATGVGMSPVNLTGSILYANNTDAGTASASVSWAGDANHTGNSDSTTFEIEQAPSTVTLTCPVSVVYDGSAQEPCTAEATGVGMSPVDLTSSILYANNIDAGTATVDVSWAGDANHTGNSNSTTFEIEPKTVTGIFTVANKVWDGSMSATILTRSLSGVISPDDCELSGGTTAFPSSAVGTHTLTLIGWSLVGDDCDNYDLPANPTTSASISAWNALGYGFYQPVGVANTVFTAAPSSAPATNTGEPWNSVKGGSTVPLKFNVFAGPVEKTSLSDIQSFNQSKLSSCTGGTGIEPVEELVTTGGTTLRYEDHQWIQNWKTPKVTFETCYRAWVTFADGSSLEAFFKLKK